MPCNREGQLRIEPLLLVYAILCERSQLVGYSTEIVPGSSINFYPGALLDE